MIYHSIPKSQFSLILLHIVQGNTSAGTLTTIKMRRCMVNSRKNEEVPYSPAPPIIPLVASFNIGPNV